jgi:hypothetical protein
MLRRSAVVLASAAFLAVSASPAMAASSKSSCVGEFSSFGARAAQPNFGKFVSGDALTFGGVGGFLPVFAQYPGDCADIAPTLPT